MERLRAAPGVEQASVTHRLPLGGAAWGEWIRVPGVNDPLLVRIKMIDPQYFAALGIPVVAGRGIEDRDRAGRTARSTFEQA